MDATGESANALNLSAEEKRVFGLLFRQADTENIGVVTGEVAVKFFEKTRLDPHVLGEIWQIADTENRGLLTPAGFGKVLRLIGHYQAGRTPTPELAFMPGPLPKFDGGAPGSTTIQPPPGPPPSAMQPQGTGQGIRVPPLTPDRVSQYSSLFEKSGGAQSGLLAGEQSRAIFERAGLPNEILGRIWALADVEQRGALNVTEFIIAMHLLASFKSRAMTALPTILPPGLYEAASRRPPARQMSGQTTGGIGPIPRQISGAPRGASPMSGSAYGAPQQMTRQVTGGNWAISPQDKAKFDSIFASLDKGRRGVITGEEAVPFFTESKLAEDILAQIWDLADINSEGHLNADEFAVAMHLIRQQRGKQTGRDSLPSTLPPNLIPPSMRNQMRPPTQPTAPEFDKTALSMPKSAADDLFGLDALSSPTAPPSAPTQTSMTTGGSSGPFGNPNDPFGNSRSPVATSPVNTGSPKQNTFKPFKPSSSFGQSIGYQATGGSNASSQQNRGPLSQQTSAMDDLLGDNDPVVSAKLNNETTELANLSNQISTLSTQMQDVQGQRSAAQNEVTQSSAQKRQFEERLATLRSLYEKEVKDVRGLQESLRVSKDEIQKLQKEMAMLDGTYKDLQNQRQQVFVQLQADQQENASLKERMKAVNAEVAQMKPQLEKLKLEARQQKGLVAINKKQLATNEGEREKVKNEIDEVTKSNEETARAIAEANSRVHSPTPSMASPTPSTNNPFFRRQQSVDITPTPTYSQSPGGDRSFDNIFGPTIVTPEVPEKVPSESSEPRTASPLPVREASTERNISLSEPPAPPESRQISSSFLPFPHPQRNDSLSSSRQVSAPTSRFGEESSSGVDTPPTTTAPTSSTTAGPVEAVRGMSPTYDRNMTASPATSEAHSAVHGSIPGAFPGDTTSSATTPSGINSLAAATDAFPALEKEDRTPIATKNDFDAAFADFKTSPSRPQERQNTGSSSVSAAPKEFKSEFPPMAELENNDDSDDSASEHPGFEDDFTSASPGPARKASTGMDAIAAQPSVDPPTENAQASPPSYEKALGAEPPPSDNHQFDGLLPSREDPTTTNKSTDDIFGGPLASSQSPFSQPSYAFSAAANTQLPESPFPNSGPSATTIQAPQSSFPTTTTTQIPPPPAKVPFDQFDDEFDDLEDAQEGDAEDLGDLSTLEHSTMDDFNPVFDSPSGTSKTSNHAATDSGIFGHGGGFNNAFAEFNASQSSNTNHPATSTPQPPPQESHDWDAIFSNLDNTPSESTVAPSTNGNGLGNGNGVQSGLAAPELKEKPQLGRALTEGGEHDDPILKNLTGMGYPRKDALAALEKYDYNLERAANYLASQS